MAPFQSYQSFARASLCIAIAGLGGSVAAYLHMPLPYMLGAIFLTMIASLFGAPLARPSGKVVTVMRVVLGVMLGSTVTPDLLDHIWAIFGAAIAVPIFSIVATVFGFVYYTRLAHYPKDEAFFCAVPGGLHVMTTYAEESGVDIRRVSLAHAMRITFVVLLVPFASKLFADFPDVGLVRSASRIWDAQIFELLLLASAGVIGWILGRAARLPGGQILGPMLVSAALHAGGLTAAKPPFEAVVIAQVILGANIGSRYLGVKLGMVRDAVMFAFGHVIVMLTLGLMFALSLHTLLGVPILTGLLSFAPGGMAEIGLIALALGLDVGFVATLQASRLIAIAALVPIAWRRINSHIKR